MGPAKTVGRPPTPKKFCTDRPRKIGAKWTGKDFKPDEVIQEISLDFDGKRDRWNGYDPTNHVSVLEKFEKIDQERKQKKAAALNAIANAPTEDNAQDGEEKKKGEDSDEDDSEEDDENKEFKETEGYNNAPITKVDPRTRTTIRNLRIREDTAKYLRNLDLNSAFYDPKTRSMRENPNPPTIPLEEQVYCGDNFVRNTGEAKRFFDMENFAWEAYEKGQDIHMEGTPSQALLLHEQYKQKKEQLKKKQKEAIIGKYGGEEHLNNLPKELVFSQTESFIEYGRDGRPLKGQEKVVVRTKYEEDVYINNHTAVWGSYWESSQWGYACCKQLVKNTYCTGEAGKMAKDEIQKQLRASLNKAVSQKENEKESEAKKSALSHKPTKNPLNKFGDEDTLDEKKLDDERLKKALKEEHKRHKDTELDERKRQYNSLSGDSYEVTEEEMEAYRMKKVKFDDPMRNFFDQPQAGDKRVK